MGNRYRPLLNVGTNAGLAQLVGGVGYGVAQAGKQIVDLGSDWDRQDTRDAQIVAEEKIRLAKEAAAAKEKLANETALRDKNYVLNPAMAKRVNEQYGITGDIAKDTTAPTLANATLGRVDFGSPKADDGFTLKQGEARYDATGKQLVALDKKETNDAFKTIVDANDKVHLIYKDGTVKPTGLTSKDYWKSNGGGSGSTDKKVPQGYVYAGNFNIDDELDDELATSGAYYTDDKNGKTYVNVSKYKNLIDLGNTNIK